MKYEDKNGAVLYGYSQIDLKENTKWLKYLVVTVGGVGSMFVAYMIWITMYVIRHNVLNNIVRECLK